MDEQEKKIGVIVNPLAGIGGRVGLKGSDGPEIQRLAWERGAKQESPRRALTALEALAAGARKARVITCPGQMGQSECLSAGLNPEVLSLSVSEPTTPQDTEEAARAMVEQGVDLLLFAGGDGTARNIYQATGGKIPAIGIPAGVKIHSAVFAKNPQSAGRLAAQFIEGRITALRELEVMDIDEEAYRSGHVSAKLYGYLPVPFAEEMVQKLKAGSSNERSALNAIATEIVEHMEPDCLYILGAGTTTRCVTDYLGLEKTLLGVDVIQNRKIVARDVGEEELLRLIEGKRSELIITPIGGQGCLFGRGNQQLSSRVIQMVGPEHITVIATLQKIVDLNGSPFFVDLDDGATSQRLSGHIRVVTGYRQQLVYPVKA